LKEEALNRSVRKTRFGRGYGPVVRQTAWRRRLKGNPQTNQAFDELVTDQLTLQLRLG
jgi:hypothetical protein